ADAKAEPDCVLDGIPNNGVGGDALEDADTCRFRRLKENTEYWKNDKQRDDRNY
ncbi:MAG: hypothetical protein RLZZ277_446, partial [Actinomycetota bacterium]